MRLQPARRWCLVLALTVLAILAAAPASAQLPTLPDPTQAPTLPQVPDVPGVDLPDVPAPAGVVTTVQDTVSQVTGGGGGGATSGGGSGTDPSPATSGGSDSPPVVDSSAPTGGSPESAPDPGPGPDGSSSGRGRSNPPDRVRPTARAPGSSPAPSRGTPTSAARPARGSNGGPPPEPETRTFATRFGNAIASLPSGILIGLLGLGAIALLMTGRSAWFVRTTDRLKLQRSELRSDVGALQSALVPDIPAAIAGASVAVGYRPAAGPAAGGDFHDVFELEDDRIGIVVGDVSGHGPDALPATGIVRYTIRAYIEAGLEPRAALRLADHAISSSLGDDYATAVAAIYDSRAGTLTYACAGHPAPLIAGGLGHRNVAVLSAPPIGLGHATGSRQTEVSVAHGARIWFFTDGLTEAHENDEPMLGREGLEADLEDSGLQPGALLELISKRAAGADDDMTAVRLEPDAGTAEPKSIETLEVRHGVDMGALSEFLAGCGVKPQRAARVVARIESLRREDGAVEVKVSRRGSRVICDLADVPGRRGDRDRADVSAAAAFIPATEEMGTPTAFRATP